MNLVCATIITGLLFAGPSEALRSQEMRVEQAASDVASARSEGARKREISRLMGLYRAEAEALLKLEQGFWQGENSQSGAAVDPQKHAQSQLREALAQGQAATPARAVLGEQIDPLEEKLVHFQSLARQVGQISNPKWQKTAYLDLADGLQLWLLVASYDLDRLVSQASALRLRAQSLSTQAAPGLGQNLGNATESRRFREQAQLLENQAQELLIKRGLAQALLTQIHQQLGGHP